MSPTLLADPGALASKGEDSDEFTGDSRAVRLVLIKPQQGDDIIGDTMEVRWYVQGFIMREDFDRDVVLVMNGQIMNVAVSWEACLPLDLL